MPLPIFHCRRKNSEGRGGGDKEKRSRWLRRLELEYARGKTVRSGGHQDCATSYRHGNRPYRTRRGHHYHGNPCDESRGPLHQVNKAALNDMRKRREKNKWGGQRVLLGREMEGLDVWGRRVGDGGGREKWEMANKKKKLEKKGWWRERSCLLNVAVPREQTQKHHLPGSRNH